jgi:DNA-directed RNA polymerase specialized sigma24 family protein
MELQETKRPARIHELCGDRAQPRKSQVVEMRVFGGLSAKDIATVLHTTEATVRRDWNIARAWLYLCMQGGRAS